MYLKNQLYTEDGPPPLPTEKIAHCVHHKTQPIIDLGLL